MSKKYSVTNHGQEQAVRVWTIRYNRSSTRTAFGHLENKTVATEAVLLWQFIHRLFNLERHTWFHGCDMAPSVQELIGKFE